MQAEFPPPRRNGFIISGVVAPPKTKPRVFYAAENKRKKLKFNINIDIDFLSTFKNAFESYVQSATKINKAFLRTTVSTILCVCSLALFFKFFGFGTAIYQDGELVTVTKSDEQYTSALKSAEKKLGKKDSQFLFSLKTAPTLYLRKSMNSGKALVNSLILSSPDYLSGYSLYSGGEKIYTAKTKAIAQEVLDKYIGALSMNGKISSVSDVKIKKEIVKESEIFSKKECQKHLEESGSVNVVSVVNSSVEEAIPYDIQTQNDNTLYLGENITVTEGSTGTKEIFRKSTYKNGLLFSEITTSELITSQPVTKVVRTGTKQKNILESGVIFPMAGVISSHFGERWGRVHEGIDLAADEGTPVLSAECGVVSYVSENAGGYGKYIRIDHGFGLQTAYGHLSKIDVKVGQTVSSGQHIALSGNTGNSTGPHLHFEIIKNGEQINPYPYMKKR